MKKAQVTLFIIVGVVLLLGVIISLTLFRDYLSERPEEHQGQEDVDTRLTTLVNYVKQCQVALTDEAIRKALSHGGYIDPQQGGVIATIPPAGTGMSAGGVVAYWSHITAGKHASQKPQLHGATSNALNVQIADYVDERLEECVQWDTLHEYSEIIRGSPRSQVSFAGGRTTIVTIYDMRVTSTAGETDIRTFTSNLNAPVADLYYAASEFTDELWRTRMPERRTLDWLALYADGSNELPPLYGGLQETYDIRPYPLGPAQGALSDVLSVHAESIELAGSREIQHVRYDDAELINQLYLSGLVSVLDTSVEHMKLDGLYLESFGMWWLVNGQAGVAMPEITKLPGPVQWIAPPLVDYTFYYDLTYPILFTLEQDGYELRFGYEVAIDNSGPQFAEDIPEFDANIACQNPGGQELDLQVTPIDVQSWVTYECGGVTCALGETLDGRLETTLPACARGTLEANAPEWFSEPHSISSDAHGVLPPQRIDLHKPRRAKITVRARDVSELPDGTFSMSDNSQLADAQVVMIRQEAPFVITPDADGYADVVPGRYDVFIIYITEFPDDDAYVIPEEEICPGDIGFVADIFSDADEECVTIDEIEFKQIPTVYAQYEGTNGVLIDQAVDEVIINAAGMNYFNLRSVEDIGLIGAVFEQGAQMVSSENVELVLN